MATISKTSTFEVPKLSQNFSPFRFRWILPADLAMGLRLPRPHTAALGSPQRPRFMPRAAHRGQGSRGCGGRRRPRPRTKDLKWEALREEVDERLKVQF